MTHPIRFVVAAALALATPLAGQARRPAPQPTLAPARARSFLLGGVGLGYYAGRTADLSLTGVNLFGSFPLRARFALRYSSGDGGDAQAARHAFINDNTNGTPQDKAHTWGLKLDLLYPVALLRKQHTHAFFGMRHARYTGNYRLVGANEDFDVKSAHWGLGAGLETEWPVSPRVNFTLTAGADYFFGSRMYGHDTAYTPSGNGEENPRAGFSYSDADEAVTQPKFAPILLAGFQLRL